MLPAHERRAEALKDLEDLRPKLTTNIKYKKPKIRGPNPLSVKKKDSKRKANVVPAPEPAVDKKAKRKRHKKRGAAASNVAEANS